ncbi:MAG: sulfotransferase [Gammaproteobacteria bacterium]|nr:sulfotransferase [Gammaproteobacteria bacterium]MDH5303689.1 sulfotransferase [Gammaproteobacteria bacterium]
MHQPGSDRDSAEIAQGVEQMRSAAPDAAAETFRRVLKRNPENVNAIRLLALSYRQGNKKLDDAEALLRRAVGLAPAYASAWRALGALLGERHKYAETIAAFTRACELEPDDAEAWAGLGNAYSLAMCPAEAARAFARCVELQPDSPDAQCGYGHALHSCGDMPGALRAFRAAIACRPTFGHAYWSLANLEAFRFDDAEVAAMLQQLDNERLTESSDIHLRFALGKAFEDRKDYDQAWHYFHTGNQRQRMATSYDPMEMEFRLDAVRDIFSKEFIEQHAGKGCAAAGPIFIVGLPCSATIMVEQILAAHSQVEGAAQRPVLEQLVNAIGGHGRGGMRYPESVRDLYDRDWRALGEQYLKESHRHYPTGRPISIDKRPGNFAYVGLIHLILPNAKIINARRHPLDGCLDCYQQLCGQAQEFTYDLLELAHYYRQYDTTMKHWHDILPGKVLDVHYEEIVTDRDSQVAKILAYCGLEIPRPATTRSSEHVCQPELAGAPGKWQRYEPYLGVLQKQLNYIVDELPAAARDVRL